jgi:magnesium-transporting ATPase (P-type)
MLRPYTLAGSGSSYVNVQIWWLLGAMYTLSLLTAFNYEKLDVLIMLRRIIVYLSVCAAFIFISLSVVEEFLSEVHTSNGIQYHAYTSSRRVAEFIIVLIPTFLVFYCYSRRLFFRGKSQYRQLLYSILPILLIYGLASLIYIRYELLSSEELDKIRQEIGVFG